MTGSVLPAAKAVVVLTDCRGLAGDGPVKAERHEVLTAVIDSGDSLSDLSFVIPAAKANRWSDLLAPWL